MKKKNLFTFLILFLDLIICLLSVVTVAGQSPSSPTVVRTGEFKKWHRLTFTFNGPSLAENSTPNPFLDYRFEVIFTSSDNHSYKVPGYFAADGNAAETGASSGNKWRVHFTPDATGTWTYLVSFKQGANIAVSDDPNAGMPVSPMDKAQDTFTIAPSDKTGKDLRAKGRLEYIGAAYLRFAETKAYFRKAGADAPENFLAYDDFDNTPDSGGRRKSWSPHVQDWHTGDPTWKNGMGKGIIGAINYLSAQGINAFSFLTMNINGDDKNVFPYVSPSDFTRFDVSKLDQWEIVMEHAQKLGMYLHFKLQETENNNLLNGGDLGRERKLYCKELIARFSHHLALNWNLGEENTQTDQQRKDMAQYIHDHDPYKHNIVVHTHPGKQKDVYRPLLGTASEVTGASIQTNTNNVYAETRKWVEASAAAGKKWIVANDEQNPADVGVAADADYTGNRGTIADNSDEIRRTVLWGNFMAGGAGVEYYFGYKTGETDLTCQDFRSRAKSWRYARYALDFFNTYLSTVAPKPLSNVSKGWSLGVDSTIYVVYIKKGGSSNITIPKGNYTVRWYDPRTGGALQSGTVTNITSGTASIGYPPSNVRSDWVALIKNVSLSNRSAYQAEDYTAQSGTTIAILHKGYTGMGYVDYGGYGSWIEFNYITKSSGTATLTFYYANGSAGNRSCAILVNNKTIGTLSFAPTGSWTTWKTTKIEVSLPYSLNKLKVEATTSSGGPNLDKIAVATTTATASTAPAFLERLDSSNNQEVTIYPNPTTGTINIVSAFPVVINIYTSQGVLIDQRKTIQNREQIDLSSFIAGIYYIKWMREGKEGVYKIVIQK